MKLIIKISLILTVLFLFSCKKEKVKNSGNFQPVPTTEDMIVGQWRLDSSFYYGVTPVGLSACERLQTLSFTQDSVYTAMSYSGDSCATVSVFNGYYNFYSDNSFSIEDEYLYIPSYVISIDENYLRLSYSESITEDLYVRE